MTRLATFIRMSRKLMTIFCDCASSNQVLSSPAYGTRKSLPLAVEMVRKSTLTIISEQRRLSQQTAVVDNPVVMSRTATANTAT
jgi:hypothetical protein